MTDDRLPPAEALAESGKDDFLRSVAEAVPRLPMRADVDGVIGAARHERTCGRLNCRNGFHDLAPDARLGPLQLRVPKLRRGSCFPPFPEPGKTSEEVLIAVIQG